MLESSAYIAEAYLCVACISTFPALFTRPRREAFLCVFCMKIQIARMTAQTVAVPLRTAAQTIHEWMQIFQMYTIIKNRRRQAGMAECAFGNPMDGSGGTDKTGSQETARSHKEP